MPVIGQRTFIQSPTTDRYLSLAKEEFVRQIDWTGINLSNWNTCRVCMSAAIQDSGGGNISGDLFVGLCSGTAFPYASASCLNAVGTLMTGTWTYNAGANPYYSNGSHNRVQKVGVTTTSNGAGSWTAYIPTTAGSIQRRGWYGPRLSALAATSVTVGQLTEAAATAQVDVSNENFLYTTNQGATTPLVVEVSASLSGPLAISGLAAGWNTNPLNAINIYWSSATYALEIYMVAVTLY